MSDSELDEIVKNVFSTQWLSCYPCDTTVNGVSYAGVACKRVFAKSRYWKSAYKVSSASNNSP